MYHTSHKILSRKALQALCQSWRVHKHKIVFTNGCFDLLHPGHIDYLEQAARLGGKLVVGLNTDQSVQRLKGLKRPIQDENSRAKILAALEFVSAVCLFEEDTPYELIQALQPEILVKGADYQPEEIVGYDIVTANGGEVRTISFLAGYSSSAIIHKIQVE